MDIPPDLVVAKDAVELGLLSLPGVVGVGLGAREENEEFFAFAPDGKFAAMSLISNVESALGISVVWA